MASSKEPRLWRERTAPEALLYVALVLLGGAVIALGVLLKRSGAAGAKVLVAIGLTTATACPVLLGLVRASHRARGRARKERLGDTEFIEYLRAEDPEIDDRVAIAVREVLAFTLDVEPNSLLPWDDQQALARHSDNQKLAPFAFEVVVGVMRHLQTERGDDEIARMCARLPSEAETLLAMTRLLQEELGTARIH